MEKEYIKHLDCGTSSPFETCVGFDYDFYFVEGDFNNYVYLIWVGSENYTAWRLPEYVEYDDCRELLKPCSFISKYIALNEFSHHSRFLKYDVLANNLKYQGVKFIDYLRNQVTLNRNNIYVCENFNLHKKQVKVND